MIRVYATFAMFMGCGAYPPSLCDTENSDEVVTQCVVETFNKYAGCLVLTVEESGKVSINASGRVLNISYVPNVPSDNGEKYGGITSGNSIQIEHKGQPDYYIEATELMHELGHAFGLRYLNNPNDPSHSPNPDDIMYESVNTLMNTENMTNYMSQLKSQNLVNCN